MKKLFTLLIVAMCSWSGMQAQNDCATAVPITTIPFSSGTQTTCGTGNDFAAGTLAGSANYGGGEDYVYALTVTAANLTLKFDLAGSATYKVMAIHSACPPSSANGVGFINTSTGTSGSTIVTFPSAGLYYIIIDTWPAPACGEFTLNITLPPAAPNCATLTGPANGSTVATLKPTFSWTPSATGAAPTAYKLYLGTVNPPTAVTSTINAPATTYTPPNNLLFGTTYYWFVTPTNAGSDATGCNSTVFSFTTPAAPAGPANDDCATAVPLTVNTNLACAVKTAGTTLSATASTTPIAPCTGVADDDVWYSFVATATSHVISLTDVVAVGSGTSTSLYLQVLGGSCGTLTSIGCDTSSASPFTAAGLTIGNTYYARVYNSGTGSTVGANSFNICVGTLPPAPANDNCATATSLTVNADLNCGVKTAGYTYLATASTDVLTPCTGTADDDVWYSFVATGTTHVVSLTNVVSLGTTVSTSLYLQVLSGTCGALTSVLCDTSAASPALLTGLTAGNTYYARVYNSAAGSTVNANSFDICVGTPPPPPANDICGGAVTITPGATFAQNAITSNNFSASIDSPADVASCQSSSAKNVWFKVVVPANGNITLETDAAATNTLTDTVLSAYTSAVNGDCTTLTSIGCNDDDGNGVFSLLSLTGLNPGSTIFVSVWVWSSSSTQEGNFQISAYDGSLATTNIVKAESGVKIYPNPFSDFIRISDVKDVVSVSIVDMSGRMVKTVKPANEINLSSLKSGMYLINLKMKDGSVKTVKSIKR